MHLSRDPAPGSVTVTLTGQTLAAFFTPRHRPRAAKALQPGAGAWAAPSGKHERGTRLITLMASPLTVSRMHTCLEQETRSHEAGHVREGSGPT